MKHSNSCQVIVPLTHQKLGEYIWRLTHQKLGEYIWRHTPEIRQVYMETQEHKLRCTISQQGETIMLQPNLNEYVTKLYR